MNDFAKRIHGFINPALKKSGMRSNKGEETAALNINYDCDYEGGDGCEPTDFEDDGQIHVDTRLCWFVLVCAIV